MRKMLLPILIFLAACNSKQEDKKIEKNEKNENTDYLVTINGIGPFRTDMIRENLDSILNKKVVLINAVDTGSGAWHDSARFQYKEADIRVAFVRTDVNEDSFILWVNRLKTNSPLCKTQNGIGVGATKQQIIDAYDDHLIIVTPDYEDTTKTTRSKTMYTIKVREEREGGQIIFYIKDKKVYAVEVSSYYDDSE